MQIAAEGGPVGGEEGDAALVPSGAKGKGAAAGAGGAVGNGRYAKHLGRLLGLIGCVLSHQNQIKFD